MRPLTDRRGFFVSTEFLRIIMTPLLSGIILPEDDLIRIPGGNIVWQQIFINMRLTSIQEELEQSTITREELLNQINDIVYTIQSFRVPVTNGTVTLTVSRQKILENGQIEIGVGYHPIEPECHENMFKEPMEVYLKELFKTLKHTLKSTDPTILSGININYFSYVMYYKEGILNFISRDFLSNLDKANILSTVNFLDAYNNLDLALSDLVIPMDRLPKFSPAYSMTMDRAIKRIKTIYHAHHKGNFKGLPYTLTDNPTMTVHQNHNSSWDTSSRVLLPIFDLSVSATIYYGGDKSELRNVLIKKFEHFGIQFN